MHVIFTFESPTGLWWCSTPGSLITPGCGRSKSAARRDFNAELRLFQSVFGRKVTAP